MPLPTRVRLLDVAPRDGLQNEAQAIATADKLSLIDKLQRAGLQQMEVASFVSPKWVPQMADAAQVMSELERQAGVRYSALVPNMKGFEGALAGKADEIVVFAAATEAFSLKNTNCSIAESFERMAPVVAAAHAAGITVKGPISCALGCPYEGEVSATQVGRLAQAYREVGVDHVYIADTIGVGTPAKVQAALEATLAHWPLEKVSVHFHDTYGQALANIYAALELGVAQVESSVAGIGGCPYAKGATGNVATEDVVYLLHGLGIDTGIDLDALVDAGAFISGVLGRKPASRVANAMLAKRARA
jgi:hydroxymethylglutaryl-CoA lyase